MNDAFSMPRKPRYWLNLFSCAALIFALVGPYAVARAQDTRIIKADAQIDGLDPGIRLFVREKMA
jgi:hypothetical protein